MPSGEPEGGGGERGSAEAKTLYELLGELLGRDGVLAWVVADKTTVNGWSAS